ncbi:hypothetical protein EON65_17840 [archaeon]|nr:MAG: hypothetical protein EON65_17840 [archaeon]
MFFLPQWLVFMFGLSSFTIAYMRLRKGLKHTFLPKMKLLLTNVISMVAQALYWGIFFILFSSAFLMRDSPPNYILNNVLYFTLASKGFSSLFVWFFINDYNLKQFESVDANVALREEVLTFATMGIRSAARDGANASPSREEIVRSPVDSRVGDDNLISLYFFFKVLMGYSEEMRHLETIMSMTRKKALEDHSDSRPTGVEVPLPCSHSIDVDNNDLARTTTIEGKIPALVVGNMIEVMSADARHFAQQRDTISMLETEREENPASSGVVLGSSIVSGLKRCNYVDLYLFYVYFFYLHSCNGI